jgi:hypothetical protein
MIVRSMVKKLKTKVEAKRTVFAYAYLYVDERPRDPEVPWLAYCSLENARRCVEDTRRIISELHQHADLQDRPFGGLEIGETSVSVLPDEAGINSEVSSE